MSRSHATAARSTASQFATALAITEDLGGRQPALHPQLRLRVLDALYSHGDRAAANAAAARLEHIVDGRDAADDRPTARCVSRTCACSGSGVWPNATRRRARAAVRELRSGGAPRFPVPVGANPTTCAELIDASLAIAERGSAARDRLAHLDSLMLSGPAVGDAMRYANLVVARQYQAIGDPAHALAALQRRSYMRGLAALPRDGLTTAHGVVAPTRRYGDRAVGIAAPHGDREAAADDRRAERRSCVVCARSRAACFTKSSLPLRDESSRGSFIYRRAFRQRHTEPNLKVCCQNWIMYASTFRSVWGDALTSHRV